MNRAALYATELDDAYIYLLTLRAQGSTVRVTNYGENVTSEGSLYIAQAFEVSFPPMGEEAPPRGRVRVDNASLMFIAAIRSVSEVLKIELRVALASDPNTVDFGPLDFECRISRYTASAVELDLTYEPLLDMSVPHHTFNPAITPALFR